MGKCLFMRKGDTHTAPGSRLPSGYTELAYIQSSGTQYIDTLFNVSSNKLRVLCDWEYTVSPTDDSIFGSQNGSQFSLVFYAYSSTIAKLYVAQTPALNTYNVSTNTRYHLDASANAGTLETILNGSKLKSSFTSPFVSNYGIYLFANNSAGSAIQKTNAKLYSCQIYDNDVLVRDFVPCIKDDGEVGLYDLVGKQSYGNAGTGVFTGSEVE